MYQSWTYVITVLELSVSDGETGTNSNVPDSLVTYVTMFWLTHWQIGSIALCLSPICDGERWINVNFLSVSALWVKGWLIIEGRLSDKAMTFMISDNCVSCHLCWVTSIQTQQTWNHVDPVITTHWLMRSVSVTLQCRTPIRARTHHITQV